TGCGRVDDDVVRLVRRLGTTGRGAAGRGTTGLGATGRGATGRGATGLGATGLGTTGLGTAGRSTTGLRATGRGAAGPGSPRGRSAPRCPSPGRRLGGLVERVDGILVGGLQGGEDRPGLLVVDRHVDRGVGGGHLLGLRGGLR